MVSEWPPLSKKTTTYRSASRDNRNKSKETMKFLNQCIRCKIFFTHIVCNRIQNIKNKDLSSAKSILLTNNPFRKRTTKQQHTGFYLVSQFSKIYFIYSKKFSHDTIRLLLVIWKCMRTKIKYFWKRGKESVIRVINWLTKRSITSNSWTSYVQGYVPSSKCTTSPTNFDQDQSIYIYL